MNPDENIDNIAQTFFLLMILCSVISDSHFVIHERSPRIQYLFDSLQALFIFGFTQKQQERIVWIDSGESSVERGSKEISGESSVEGGSKEISGESSVEGVLPRVFDSCKEIPAESSVEKSVTKVSFQEPIQTILQPELPPKKKKLLEDREKGSKAGSKAKSLKEESNAVPKASLVKRRTKSKIK